MGKKTRDTNRSDALQYTHSVMQLMPLMKGQMFGLTATVLYQTERPSYMYPICTAFNCQIFIANADPIKYA